jgi:hypothetical protein
VRLRVGTEQPIVAVVVVAVVRLQAAHFQIHQEAQAAPASSS